MAPSSNLTNTTTAASTTTKTNIMHPTSVGMIVDGVISNTTGQYSSEQSDIIIVK
jgi:hypothetical protein